MGSFAPDSAEPAVLLGRFAGLLAEGAPLGAALHLLATGVPVRSVVLRSTSGELLAVGGEALQVMQQIPSQQVGLEFPVPGPDGPIATLSVRDGRPSHLPLLRAAAAVLGLALAASCPADALVEDRERELDELADVLHDGPLQSLMVARYAADAVVRGGDPELAREAVQEAVVGLRKVEWSLRPRGDAGLLSALERLAETRRKDGETQLQLDVPQQEVPLEARAARLAYRIVQAAAPDQARVTLQNEGICVEINSGLPHAARWARRAEALGCRLTAAADHCTLLLPRAASSYSTDVRTTS